MPFGERTGMFPRLLIATHLLLLCVGAAAAERPRVVVLTDISSLTPRLREPDDGQSLVRLLLFSNDLDIEGIVASSNMGHGAVTRPELVRQVIDAYEEVYPSLLRHDARYPAPAALRAVVRAGQPVAGPKVAYTDSIGPGKDTPGSDLIIRAADRSDPRPLWILVWGGTADLAQALWRVRSQRDPEMQQRFARKLRVHAIHDQDSTGPVIKQEWPDLFYITRTYSIRGMYRGGDRTLVSPEWVKQYVSQGFGALGSIYPNYDGGDIWSSKLGRVEGVKEGDTPSLLFLLQNGLNDPARPELGGWGGRILPEDASRLRWLDAADGDAAPGDPDPRMSTVYRWRPDFQNEMRLRLEWCVKTPEQVNHAPVVRLRGAPVRRLRAGLTILDAGASSDPDGDTLDIEWFIYPPAPDAGIRLRATGTGKATLDVPAGHELPDSISAVVRVRDHGSPPLSRYGRIELRRR